MNIGEQWVEYLFLIVLVLGFIFAIFIKSVFLILLVSFLFGVFFSKLLAFDKKRSNLPYILIVLGFVVGFFVGSLLETGEIRPNLGGRIEQRSGGLELLRYIGRKGDEINPDYILGELKKARNATRREAEGHRSNLAATRDLAAKLTKEIIEFM